MPPEEFPNTANAILNAANKGAILQAKWMCSKANVRDNACLASAGVGGLDYFTSVTGQFARCSTFVATEPRINPLTVPSPRVPMMI